MIKLAYGDALLSVCGSEEGGALFSFIKMDGFTSVGATKFNLNRAEVMALMVALSEQLGRAMEPGRGLIALRVNPLMVKGEIEEIDDD